MTRISCYARRAVGEHSPGHKDGQGGQEDDDGSDGNDGPEGAGHFGVVMGSATARNPLGPAPDGKDCECADDEGGAGGENKPEQSGQ